MKKAIVASLDTRINEIKNKLAETEKLKNDAKLLLDEIQHEMKSFEDDAKNILKSAELSTQRLVEKKSKEMELLLARKKDSAIKAIDTQKAKASEAMRADFTKSVLNIVRTYLVETKNNSVTDEEIINHLIKK